MSELKKGDNAMVLFVDLYDADHGVRVGDIVSVLQGGSAPYCKHKLVGIWSFVRFQLKKVESEEPKLKVGDAVEIDYEELSKFLQTKCSNKDQIIEQLKRRINELENEK